MGHADDDLARRRSAPPYLITASSAGIIDLAAVEPEALGADIFAGEELLPLLALDDLWRGSTCLPSGVKLDRGVLPLHPLLQEAALLEVVDVHIFEADIAAIIGAQHIDDLAHGSLSRSPSAPPR